MKGYIVDYIYNVKKLLDNLDTGIIEKVTRFIESAYNTGNYIYIIGNGGSASTASHMANDFLKNICTNSEGGFKVLSLTDNNSIITAISNDEGYENLFINQLKVFLKKDDVLIAISASGNSANILNAIEYAKNRGAKTIGFVGFDGGKLRDMVDVCVHIKTSKGVYGPVEDIHLILNHIISGYLKDKFNKKSMLV